MRPVAREQELDTFWRLRTATGRTLTCAIYRADTGLTVRASFGPNDIVRSQLVPDVVVGRELAAKWHQSLRDQGGFVPADEPAGGAEVNDTPARGRSTALPIRSCPYCVATDLRLRSVQAGGRAVTLECGTCHRSWLQEVTPQTIEELRRQNE